MAEQITNEPDNEGTQGTQTAEQTGQSQSIDIEVVKKEAVNALLKDMGISDSDTLKNIVTKHNEEEESKKTDLQKKDDSISNLTRELASEKSARILSEAKLAAVKLGAKVELVDDLALLAQAKTTPEKDINTVIAEIKNSETGKVYFVLEEEEEQNPKNNNTTRKGMSEVGASQGAKKDNEEGENKYSGTMASRLLSGRKKHNNYYYK